MLDQDHREGGLARVVTRGPGAFRGPEKCLLCLPFFVFNFPLKKCLDPWAHWHSKQEVFRHEVNDFFI